MAVRKLSLSEFDAIDYQLIAIHTLLEDYRLAYLINQKLPILLGKSNEDLEFKTLNGTAFFTKYSYIVKDTEEEWNLIENKDELLTVNNNSSTNLFSLENQKITSNVFLVPEMKKVDFFLKIENALLPLTDIVTQINTISQVSTAYSLDPENLKSKNNLIF